MIRRLPPPPFSTSVVMPPLESFTILRVAPLTMAFSVGNAPREYHAAGNRVVTVDYAIGVGIEHRVVEHLTAERIELGQFTGAETRTRIGGINAGGGKHYPPPSTRLA
jgi:hypothetical protein